MIPNILNVAPIHAAGARRCRSANCSGCCGRKPQSVRTGGVLPLRLLRPSRVFLTESAAAMRYWWGVSVTTVAAWRRAYGVEKVDAPGSDMGRRASSRRGATRRGVNRCR